MGRRLALTRRLVELRDGAASMESALEVGAKASLFLPSHSLC